MARDMRHLPAELEPEGISIFSTEAVAWCLTVKIGQFPWEKIHEIQNQSDRHKRGVHLFRHEYSYNLTQAHGR